MNKIVLFLVLSYKIILQSEVVGKIPELEENLFSSLNLQLQDVVNEIFVLLKLSKSLAVKYDNRLLLALHASLKKSSEKKYTTFKTLHEISKLDNEYKVQANSSLFLLDKPVNEIIKEKYAMYNSGRKSTNLQSESDSIEIPQNSEEAHVVLRDYLRNVENVDLPDIVKPFEKITEIYEKHRKLQRAFRRNFKVWKADNLTELLEETRRVFDGRFVPINKFPFVASIHVDGNFVCTGSIISRDMIITAASCLQAAYYNPNYLKDNPNSVVVRVGSDYSDRGGDLVSVISIHINPLYRSSTLRNNVAIVRIKKYLHLRKKSKKMRRIEYKKVPSGAAPATDNKILLLGWGDKDAPVSDVAEDNRLRYASLNVIKLQSCMETYTTTYVSDRNFCAGTSGKGSGACQRDIGGPAIIDSQLVGVVSFGPPVCGTTDASTVFTSIANHINWIHSIVTGDMRKLNPPTVGSIFFTRGPSNETNNNYSQKARNIEAQRILAQSKRTLGEKKLYNNIFSINDASHRIRTENRFRGHYPKAMHLLSFALRQIMEHSYEWVDDDFYTLPDTHLWPTTEPVSLEAHSLASLNVFYLEDANHENTTPHINLKNERNFLKEQLHLYPRNQKKNWHKSFGDNYETDEKGLSIELSNVSTKNRYKSKKVPAVITLGDTQDYFNEDSEKLRIKNFVKTHLSPLSNKIKSSEQITNYERNAVNFLMDNLVKGHISPMNATIEFDRVKKNRDTKDVSEISSKIQIDNYLNDKAMINAKASNELVLMFHKQSTIKNMRHKFDDRNIIGFGDFKEEVDSKDFVEMSLEKIKPSANTNKIKVKHTTRFKKSHTKKQSYKTKKDKYIKNKGKKLASKKNQIVNQMHVITLDKPITKASLSFPNSEQSTESQNDDVGNLKLVDEDSESRTITTTEDYIMTMSTFLSTTKNGDSLDQVIFLADYQEPNNVPNDDRNYIIPNDETNNLDKEFSDNDQKQNDASNVEIDNDMRRYSLENIKSGRRSFLDYIDLS